MAKITENISVEREIARRDTDKHPSINQAKAGNYKKGKIKFNGFLITIENPKGSYRRGKDKDGHEWKTLMHNDYGYFNRTVGKDGDAIDVFLGPNLKSEKIFPIDQFLNGEFDETKVMLGFNTAEDAKAAYLSNYEKNWKGFKYITEIDLDTFKKWLYDGYRQRKPFAKYVRLTEDKERQLGIINDTNPMLDDYHTGIRKVEDIKTFEEAMAEAKADFDEYGYYSSYPDTPNSVLENALKTGKITVYSSKPIVNGNFVTTSKMCAKDYAGGGKIYTETLPTSDVAWINVEEGQIARANRLNESPDGYDKTHYYTDDDAYAFMRIGGEYYLSYPGESHSSMLQRLDSEGYIERVQNDEEYLWSSTSGRYWKSSNVIAFWDTPFDDISTMNDAVHFLQEEGVMDDFRTLLVDVWDYNRMSESLVPYKWFINGTFSFIMKDMKATGVYKQGDNIFRVSSENNVFCMDIDGNVVNNPYEYKQVDEAWNGDGDEMDFIYPETVPDKLYHASPISNRESIMANGLVPSIGDEYYDWWSYEGPNGECDGLDIPELVFLSSTPEMWLQLLNVSEGYDVYEVDTSKIDKSDITLDPTPSLAKRGSYCYGGTIPPSALKIVKTLEPRKVVWESKKARKNDEGETVPETCECGGKVCVQIHGEPVFICSKCGKYYGTLPFTNESIDIKKALKRLKKRRDPANIENWDKELNENIMINENFSSQVLAKLAKEHGGIQISRNGGLRQFPCAFLRGHGVNPSDITDDMIIGEPFEYSLYDRKSENAVLFNDGTAIELDRNVELPQRTSGARRFKRFGSGIGDTGDHDKTRGGFIGKGKDAESAPYNGWQSSERAGYSQSLRDAFKVNKEMGDKKSMDAIKQKARTVYMTEEQFKAYCRQLLREKRNEDYLKNIISESVSSKANRAAYENACDCLYYGYGRDKWNSCGIEGAEADMIWNQAKEDLGNGTGRYGRFGE